MAIMGSYFVGLQIRSNQIHTGENYNMKTIGEVVATVVLIVSAAVVVVGMAVLSDGGDDLSEWDTAHYAAWCK